MRHPLLPYLSLLKTLKVESKTEKINVCLFFQWLDLREKRYLVIRLLFSHLGQQGTQTNEQINNFQSQQIYRAGYTSSHLNTEIKQHTKPYDY